MTVKEMVAAQKERITLFGQLNQKGIRERTRLIESAGLNSFPWVKKLEGNAALRVGRRNDAK